MPLRTKWVLFAVVLLSIAITVGTSYWRVHRERSNRPWAYPSAQHTQALVGSWQGEFVDPDGVRQTLQITINKPIEATRRHRRSRMRSRDYAQFEGAALIRIGSQSWPMGLSGSVRDFETGALTLRTFVESDGTWRAGFYAGEISATWIGNALHCEFGFNESNALGHGIYRSDEPKHHMRATMIMQRLSSR